ncbi:MAG: ABC transporter substrate-binding protein, partial [Acidobacteria bacterium]|nr:ABC transporter substrate-binding protein [Acidobacteriota bacterium]
NLDPRVGQDQNSWRVHQALYAALVKKGPGGTYVPSLAETMDTEDGSVWRFRLRDGLSFHDGRKLTSADVKFTFESLLAEGFASGKKEALRIVERIETPSPRDVVFHLKTPYASFPLQLLLGILPEGTKTEDARARPIGAGPYRLVSARPDEAYVFEAWEGFHEGRARLPKLVYKVVPDSTTRALELLRGSLHLAINSLPPDLLPRLAKSPGLTVNVGPGSTYFYLCFNLRDPVLGDVRVRRALALALDREALAHGLFRDTVVPSETLVPPGTWARATAEELPPLRRDLAEARRLLDAAGYPEKPGGSPRLSIAYKTSTDETSILQATAIAEQWREIGVECTLRSNDFATFFEDVRKGAFQVFSLRWQGIDDPDHYHDVFLSSAIPPKGANRGFYTNPEADQLIDDARRALDPALRRPLYVRLQQRVAQDLPYISLFTSRVVAVHDSRLTGLEALPPSGDFTFLPLVGRR